MKCDSEFNWLKVQAAQDEYYNSWSVL